MKRFRDDKLVAFEILGITLTRRANGAAQYVELVGFPHHASDTYLPKLVCVPENGWLFANSWKTETDKKIGQARYYGIGNTGCVD